MKAEDLGVEEHHKPRQNSTIIDGVHVVNAGEQLCTNRSSADRLQHVTSLGWG